MMIHQRVPDPNPLYGRCPLPERPTKHVTFAQPPEAQPRDRAQSTDAPTKCDPTAAIRCPKIIEYKDRLAAIEKQICEMDQTHREIERVPGTYFPDIKCPPKMDCPKREAKKKFAEDELYDNDGVLKSTMKSAVESDKAEASPRRDDLFAPRTDGPCQPTTCPGLNGDNKGITPNPTLPIPCDTCTETRKDKTKIAPTTGKCPILPGDPEYTTDPITFEEACRVAAHAADALPEGACPEETTIDKSVERTSDFYQTCKLPSRMDYPTNFTSFGCQRYPRQHPFYRTSANEYGWYAPNIHSVHTSFFPRDQSFTKSQAIGGMYRNYGLNLTDGDS